MWHSDCGQEASVTGSTARRSKDVGKLHGNDDDLPYDDLRARNRDVPRPPTLHREPQGTLATARHYVGDLVYGANDGLITTFAVVAGVAGGALSSRATVIVGAADLFADGLSMAVGNYLSIRSREGALAAQNLPRGRSASRKARSRHSPGVHCRR